MPFLLKKRTFLHIKINCTSGNKVRFLFFLELSIFYLHVQYLFFQLVCHRRLAFVFSYLLFFVDILTTYSIFLYFIFYCIQLDVLICLILYITCTIFKYLLFCQMSEMALVCSHVEVFGAFEKLRKATNSVVMSACLSVCLSVRPRVSLRPHGTTRLPMD
jgi:hypothetical protein